MFDLFCASIPSMAMWQDRAKDRASGISCLALGFIRSVRSSARLRGGIRRGCIAVFVVFRGWRSAADVRSHEIASTRRMRERRMKRYMDRRFSHSMCAGRVGTTSVQHESTPMRNLGRQDGCGLSCGSFRSQAVAWRIHTTFLSIPIRISPLCTHTTPIVPSR